MKIKTVIAGFSVVILAPLSADSQSAFENLSFEQANPVSSGNPPSFVTTVSALPDWAVTIGGVQQTQISYNSPSLGAPAVVLLGPAPPTPAFNPIDGNYSVLLTGSFPASVPSISQTGLIPAGTQSLLFEAQPGSGSLNVLIGTQVVPFTAVGTVPNYTLYSANISQWAGDPEQLTFSALQADSGLNNWEIDDITFVPEPNMVAMSAIGGLLFGARKWLARD